MTTLQKITKEYGNGIEGAIILSVLQQGLHQMLEDLPNHRKQEEETGRRNIVSLDLYEEVCKDVLKMIEE